MDHHPSTSSYYAQQQRELRKSCLKKSLNKHINSSQIGMMGRVFFCVHCLKMFEKRLSTKKLVPTNT